jgi:arylsulfatase
VSNGDRPNILVIWGDDIGITNLSCYSDGLMGYRTQFMTAPVRC